MMPLSGLLLLTEGGEGVVGVALIIGGVLYACKVSNTPFEKASKV